MIRARWYIGCKYDFHTGEYAFRAFAATKTPENGDYPYLYCVGPFRTKRGALWAENYGMRNPHFTSVAAAERLAKRGNK